MSAIPADRKYTKTHEWFLTQGNEVTIGITQFAADELTDITYVALPPVGRKIEAGKPFGEIESVKATSELFSAVGGEVIGANASLAESPGLVNSDPFQSGWMIRIRATDLSPLDRLMDAAAYAAMIGQT